MPTVGTGNPDSPRFAPLERDPTADSIGCRICFGAKYQSDYEGRDRRRRGWRLILEALRDPDEDGSDADFRVLFDERRRGVRRGRRVLHRAFRQLLRRQREYEQTPILIGALLQDTET